MLEVMLIQIIYRRSKHSLGLSACDYSSADESLGGIAGFRLLLCLSASIPLSRVDLCGLAVTARQD